MSAEYGAQLVGTLPTEGLSVITTGDNSYDVADFTVESTYLTPR